MIPREHKEPNSIMATEKEAVARLRQHPIQNLGKEQTSPKKTPQGGGGTKRRSLKKALVQDITLEKK